MESFPLSTQGFPFLERIGLYEPLFLFFDMVYFALASVHYLLKHFLMICCVSFDKT